MEIREQKIQDYFKLRGLSSTSLSDFNIAPDVVLMPRKEKSYFDEGIAFEIMVEDKAKGSSLFKDTFFIADISSPVPAELGTWIKEGTLEEQYVTTKSGELSKTYSGRHAWLDACIENPGKKPISNNTVFKLEIMRDNLFKAEVQIADVVTGIIHTVKAGELLSNASFQLPYFWEFNHKKKALYDCVSIMKFGDHYQAIAIDIKTTATLQQFFSMFKKRYWVQDRHYSEGLENLASEKKIKHYPYMLFFVASKEDPYLAQVFKIESESAEFATSEYLSICDDFAEWADKGRQPKGWREMEAIKLYF